MKFLIPVLTLFVFLGAGCDQSTALKSQPSSPNSQFPSPASSQQATLADFIRERRTFPTFSEIEGRAKPPELEGMEGRNFVYVNNCPDRKPSSECQYRITLFADNAKNATLFFLQESQAGKPTVFYGPITGPVSELVSAMNKVEKKILYDVP